MAEGADFSENLFYEPSVNPLIFSVTVSPNQKAESCGLRGEYEFHINHVNIAIVDPATSKPAYIWPLRYIRRYGRTAHTFQFESGRSCPSGEGLFVLSTRHGEGETIFNAVQNQVKEAGKRDANYKKDMLERRESVEPPAPSVPQRNFSEKDRYVNVAEEAGMEPESRSIVKKSKKKKDKDKDKPSKTPAAGRPSARAPAVAARPEPPKQPNINEVISKLAREQPYEGGEVDDMYDSFVDNKASLGQDDNAYGFIE